MTVKFCETCWHFVLREKKGGNSQRKMIFRRETCIARLAERAGHVASARRGQPRGGRTGRALRPGAGGPAGDPGRGSLGCAGGVLWYTM